MKLRSKLIITKVFNIVFKLNDDTSKNFTLDFGDSHSLRSQQVTLVNCDGWVDWWEIFDNPRQNLTLRTHSGILNNYNIKREVFRYFCLPYTQNVFIKNLCIPLALYRKLCAVFTITRKYSILYLISTLYFHFLHLCATPVLI